MSKSNIAIISIFLWSIIGFLLAYPFLFPVDTERDVVLDIDSGSNEFISDDNRYIFRAEFEIVEPDFSESFKELIEMTTAWFTDWVRREELCEGVEFNPAKFMYRFDFVEYWQSSCDTVVNNIGDCEDFAIAFYKSSNAKDKRIILIFNKLMKTGHAAVYINGKVYDNNGSYESKDQFFTFYPGFIEIGYFDENGITFESGALMKIAQKRK